VCEANTCASDRIFSHADRVTSQIDAAAGAPDFVARDHSAARGRLDSGANEITDGVSADYHARRDVVDPRVGRHVEKRTRTSPRRYHVSADSTGSCIKIGTGTPIEPAQLTASEIDVELGGYSRSREAAEMTAK